MFRSGNGWRFAALVVWVVASSVAVFSDGFIGVSLFQESALETSFGIGFLTFNGLLLLYGSYMLLLREQPLPSLATLHTMEDYKVLLYRFVKKDGYAPFAQQCLTQWDSFTKKHTSIEAMLQQKFGTAELSYAKFHGMLRRVEQLCHENWKRVVNRLMALEATDFQQIRNKQTDAGRRSYDGSGVEFDRGGDTGGGADSGPSAGSAGLAQLQQQKQQVISKYLNSMEEILHLNEQALLQLDQLLFEITNLDTSHMGDLDQMACIVELETLIEQTKLYRM